MALTYTQQLLSGSTNGKPIEVQTIASPGTTIHTVGASATTGHDEVHLYAWNDATATMPLQIEFGGTATTDNILVHLPSQGGLNLIVPGFPLMATTSIVRAYSTGTATEALTVGGWVNRAT